MSLFLTGDNPTGRSALSDSVSFSDLAPDMPLRELMLVLSPSQRP